MSGVVGFGARGGEEDPGVGDPGDRSDAFGQVNDRLAEEQRRGVHDLGRLVLHCGDDRRVRVADHGREDPAEEVEVAVALQVVDVAALSAVDRDGLVVERVEERGQDHAWRSPRSAVEGEAPAADDELTQPS